MPSFLITFFLTLTSLAPVLLTFGAVYWSRSCQYSMAFFGTAIALTVVCKLVLWFFKRGLATQSFRFTSVKPADQSTLSFIVAYLLPLISMTGLHIDYPTLIFVFILIFITIYHGNAYHFNPLLALVFGYHFYEVTTEENFTYVVISRKTYTTTRDAIKAVRISDYMVMEVEGE